MDLYATSPLAKVDPTSCACNYTLKANYPPWDGNRICGFTIVSNAFSELMFAQLDVTAPLCIPSVLDEFFDVMFDLISSVAQ